MFLKKLKILFVAGLFFTAGISFSQVHVSGKIYDASGKILSGANVRVENTFTSASSDADGKYQIKINKGENIIDYSFVGFQTYILKVNILKDTIIDVILENSVILGEEVNIIATRAQPGTPATFTNISSGSIEKINLGKDMPFILQSTPSVLVTSDAGNGVGYTGISIRGSDLTRINVTMNGIPVNDAESQGVWFVDLPDLASSSGNIQIQRGVGTSTNGPGAFGASINIQTQTVNQDPYAELSTSGGSYSTFKSTLRFGTGIMSNKLAFDGRVSYLTSEGYIDRAFSRLGSYHLSGGYFGKNTTIKANILTGIEKTYQAWEGVPKDSLETNRTYNPAGEYYDKNGNLTYYDNQTDNYKQDHYQLLFSQSAGQNLNFNAAFFYTKGKGYYENYKPSQKFSKYGLGEVIIGGDTISRTDLINRKYLDNDFTGLTFSGNYSAKNLKLTLGGSYSYYNGRHYGRIIWAEYAAGSTTDWNWYYNTGVKKDFTIYTKATYKAGIFNLFGDLQYRFVDHRMQGTKDDLADLNQQHTFNFFNPKAGISIDIEHHKAYFSFGVANREPNRDNYEDADPDHMPGSETLYDWEAGYDLVFNRFRAGVNLYYMNYKDQLVLTGEINNTGAAIMTNVPESYRTGIELSVAAKVAKWLDWNLNGTLSRNKIRNFTAYVEEYDADWNFLGMAPQEMGETDLSFSPGILFNNEFAFHPVKNSTLSLQSRYVGRQYIDNTSNKDRSLNPYFVQNVLATYSVHPKWMKEIVITLQVNNLFSNKYETNAWVYRAIVGGDEYSESGWFPQAPVNFLGGFIFRF